MAIYVSETHQISAGNNGNNGINETDNAIIVLDLIMVAIYTGCHNDTKVQKTLVKTLQMETQIPLCHHPNKLCFDMHNGY